MSKRKRQDTDCDNNTGRTRYKNFNLKIISYDKDIYQHMTLVFQIKRIFFMFIFSHVVI